MNARLLLHSGDYDYGQVIGLSLLFYEAQRSGYLPPNQRVAWRLNSALDDRTPSGQDVTGGWVPLNCSGLAAVAALVR